MKSAFLACVLAQTALAAASVDPPSSEFVPSVGQTQYYRYTDTITNPKGSISWTATLTLKTVAANNIQLTFAVDGKGSRSLDFYVDQTGALQPAARLEALAPSSKGDTEADKFEQRAATESLLLRLALASRIGTRQETSFPIQLDVSWSDGPVNPILSIRSTDSDGFVADANATTYINPPQSKNRSHLVLPLGLGLVGAITTGVASKVASVLGFGISVFSTGHGQPGPLPADVMLHLTGQLADGKLQTLSGDQQSIIHNGKRTTTLRDQWSLVAS